MTVLTTASHEEDWRGCIWLCCLSKYLGRRSGQDDKIRMTSSTLRRSPWGSDRKWFSSHQRVLFISLRRTVKVDHIMWAGILIIEWISRSGLTCCQHHIEGQKSWCHACESSRVPTGKHVPTGAHLLVSEHWTHSLPNQIFGQRKTAMNEWTIQD